MARGQDGMDEFFDTFGIETTSDLSSLEPSLQRPHTSNSNYQFNHGFEAPEDKAHFASDGALMDQQYLQQTPLWAISGTAPTYDMLSTLPQRSSSVFTNSPATASSAGESPLVSSPTLPQMPGTCRKRLRESLDIAHLTSDHGVKAIRATPSPAQTGPTTPCSLASFDFPEDSDLFNILGGNPKDHLQEMLKEQQERERELRDRKEQELRDEEFAKKMQDEQYQSPQANPITQRFGVPSSLSRASSQAVLDRTGTFRRPDPPPVPDAFSYPSKKEELTQTSTTPQIKRERILPTVSKSSRVEPPSIIDLDTSDDESDVEESHPSSDVLEIGSRSFQSDERGAPLSANVFSIPNFADIGGFGEHDSWMDIDRIPTTDLQPWHAPLIPPSNPYQDFAGYGGTSVYNPNIMSYPSTPANTWSSGLSSFGHGISTLATGAMSEAYRFLNAPITDFSASAAGYGNSVFSGYGTSGSSANPQLIDISTGTNRPRQPLLNNRSSTLPNNPYSTNSNNREAYQEYLDRVNYLTGSSTRTTTELKSLLENIRPDEQLDPRSRVGTPNSMSVTSPLYEHQKLGLTWLQNMEEGSNKGGILADDMGLGKTGKTYEQTR